MANLRLVQKSVVSLAKTGSEYFVWDDDLRGFGVRVQASGAKSFVVKYRAGRGRNAPTRRLTLGSFGKLTVEQARQSAKKTLGEVAIGGENAATMAKARAELKMSELADLYLLEGCTTKKASTLLNDRSRIERHIKPLLGTKRIGLITKADIEKAMRDVASGKTAVDQKSSKPKGRAVVKGGKGAAGQVVALLSSIFAFAISRNLRTENPAQGVKKYVTRKSERFLTSTELASLGDAIREAETDGIEWAIGEDRAARPTAKHTPKAPENRRTKVAPHAAAALRLLIMTGARLREILHLEWRHVDLERGLLFLPDSKTGKKTIILNAPAIAVLTSLPRIGKYVIAGENAGQDYEKPRSDLKRPWALVCRRSGLEGVRLHDLRHTHASFGAAAGLGLPIIGKLLGHTQASTTLRYAHLDNDPLRKASDRIGSEIAWAMGETFTTERLPGNQSGQVVSIARALG